MPPTTAKGSWCHHPSPRDGAATGIHMARLPIPATALPKRILRACSNPLPVAMPGWRGPRLKGTGLGLPIVRSLVELIGGTVTLTSTEDVGTRVDLFLPEAIAIEGPDGLINYSDAIRPALPALCLRRRWRGFLFILRIRQFRYRHR